tara:strand:+ start:1744 stop:2496 length:753 start_codon:yes stop_codon:yes gene_type:complete
MSMTKVNNWYFGDYLGSYQGYFYNNLIYSVTIFLFLTIALETEQSLVEKYNLDVLINFVYELVQAFFLSDYIGKLANSWAKRDYEIKKFLGSFLHFRSLFDLFTLLILISDFIPNQSPIILSAYVIKISINIYQSQLRTIINRLKFIVFSKPSKTFFPITLLSVLTYSFASVMYLVERDSDPIHFGSILRSLWFSVVSITTVGYGDVTPSSVLGKVVSTIFAFLGIICVALLTANIIEINAEYESKMQKN